ncbi:hypothetical protein LSUE1_G008491, partial [Lachnellula suecica]
MTSIHKYIFHLSSHTPCSPEPACLALVFTNPFYSSGLVSILTQNLRAALDPSWRDEIDGKFRGAQWEAFREKAVVVWTTFEWDVESRKASAWMPEALVEMMAYWA